MLRNFRSEAEVTSQRLVTAIQATVPSKQFSATIMLSLVHLRLTEQRIRKTRDPKERRKQIREFKRAKDAIEKGIRLLKDGIPHPEG